VRVLTPKSEKNEGQLKKFIGIIALCGAVSGCEPIANPPIVSGFNGSSVGIQAAGFFGNEKPTPEHAAEAARICGKVQKNAEYASSRMVSDYQIEHLYLCL
jgi:hypothetical protein